MDKFKDIEVAIDRVEHYRTVMKESAGIRCSTLYDPSGDDYPLLVGLFNAILKVGEVATDNGVDLEMAYIRYAMEIYVFLCESEFVDFKKRAAEETDEVIWRNAGNLPTVSTKNYLISDEVVVSVISGIREYVELLKFQVTRFNFDINEL